MSSESHTSPFPPLSLDRSNFDLGLKIGTQSRRAASNKGKAKQGENSEDGPSAEEEGIGTCSLEDIAPSLERLITCALAIFGVFFARNVAILVIQKCLRSDKAPEHLHFPAWEGISLHANCT